LIDLFSFNTDLCGEFITFAGQSSTFSLKSGSVSSSFSISSRARGVSCSHLDVKLERPLGDDSSSSGDHLGNGHSSLGDLDLSELI